MREQHFKQTLHDIAEEQVPGTVDLWPAIEAQAQTRRPRSRNQWLQRPLALAAVVLLALVSLFIWIGRPQPVSAEAILERAQAVTGEPSASGVETFVFTQVVSWTMVARWLPPDVEPTTDDVETIITEKRSYFQAPNLRRSEILNEEIIRGRNAFGDPREPSKGIYVNDGTDSWSYIPEKNFVIQNAPGPADNAFGMALFPGQIQMAQLPEVEGDLLECYAPAIEGSEVVAGRESWVIDLGQATGCLPPVLSGKPIDGVRVWVDKETYFVLKTVAYAVPEGTPRFVAEVTEVEYNLPLDPELFIFTPPPGAIIIVADDPNREIPVGLTPTSSTVDD